MLFNEDDRLFVCLFVWLVVCILIPYTRLTVMRNYRRQEIVTLLSLDRATYKQGLTL